MARSTAYNRHSLTTFLRNLAKVYRKIQVYHLCLPPGCDRQTITSTTTAIRRHFSQLCISSFTVMGQHISSSQSSAKTSVTPTTAPPQLLAGTSASPTPAPQQSTTRPVAFTISGVELRVYPKHLLAKKQPEVKSEGKA
ncbi:hypothetical protein PoB_000485800 [Plakobranchus ocellatus]|uniref:Uncharacterized protein n=1 Tax=Plakobranchus ocellatus TaxID=259542 RepID=A0AAV3Y844_9GAST|nr:hypothetical protein PoB_000485800 [Plakobranchus ocellatus]